MAQYLQVLCHVPILSILSPFFPLPPFFPLRVLEKVLEVLGARLVIQTAEQAREQTSVAGAEEALAGATG